MNFLRWISCHLILTIVVLSIATAWYFKQDLAKDFARLTGSEAEMASAGNEPPALPPEKAPAAQQATEMPGAPSMTAAPVPRDPAPVVEAPGMNVPEERAPQTRAATSKFPPETMHGSNSTAPGPDMTQSGMTDRPANNFEQAFESGRPPEQQTAMHTPGFAGSPGSDSMFPPDDYDPETGRMMPGDVPANPVNMASQGPAMEPAGSQETRFPDPIAVQPVTGAASNSMNSQDTAGYESRLDNARRLLWAGDLDNARQAYESLMASDPGNPEVASELGNLLLQQDRLDEAGRAYESAIGNFRRQQRDNEAIGLIRFISRYNPSLADSLYNKYWQ